MAAALIDDAMRRVGGDAGCQFDDALRRSNEILFLPGSNTSSGAIQVGPTCMHLPMTMRQPMVCPAQRQSSVISAFQDEKQAHGQ